MPLTHECIEALAVWQDRIGRHLSAGTARETLTKTYPMRSKTGLKHYRIGAGAPGAILVAAVLIDANGASIIEKLAVDLIPGLRGASVSVIQGQPDFSLQAGLMSWLLDPARAFPLLAFMPSKASIASGLKLSHSPQDIALCFPTGALRFDALRVRQTRDWIRAMPKSAITWRHACTAREQFAAGAQPRSAALRNAALDRYAEIVDQFPVDRWLPMPNTANYKALELALIVKPALPISTPAERSQDVLSIATAL